MIHSRVFWKLYLSFVFIVLFASAMAYLFVSRYVEQDGLRQTEQTLRSHARLLSEVTPELLDDSSASMLQQRVQELGSKLATRFTVIRFDGKVLADSESDVSKMENHGTRPEVLEARDKGVGISTRFSRTVGENLMYVALPILDKGDIIGYSRSSFHLVDIHRRLGHVQAVGLIGAIIGAFVALLLGLAISQRIVLPLTRMTELAQSIAEGSYNRRVVVHGNNEFSKLAVALNKMAAQISSDISRREAAEQGLKRAHNELEKRVEERTAELSGANISLEARIVEGQQAEKTLLEQQTFLRQVVDANPNLIFVKDWDGRFTFVNKAMADLYGATIESMLGTCDADLNDQEEVERFRRDDREVMASQRKKFIPEEQNTNARTGTVHWFQTIKIPLASEHSELETRQILGVATDITERKRSEAERPQLLARIREEREHLSDVIANVPGVVWETSGRPDGVVLKNDYVSDYAETLLGYSVEEWLSTPDFWLTIVHPDDKERAASDSAAILSTGRGGVSQFRWLTKDGRVLWVEAHSAVICDETGAPVRLRGVTMDISARKEAELKQARLEQQLRQAQKMESIGTLAGGIAHDFNNILNAIIGYSELASDDMPDQHSARSHLAQVLKASNRARELVQQILTFSRQQGPEREPSSLQDILKEALNLLRASLPTTIEIRQHIDQEAPLILGDPSRIHQLVMNLGTNALHAIGERGGTLEVKLETLQVDADFAQTNANLKEGNYLRLILSDTGCGMDSYTQERIFEPFFTTKEPGKGTGLGLALVYGIVKDHDGAVSVYSEPGHGTTFNIYFPVHETTARQPLIPSIPIPNGHGQRVMFVDDEEPLALLGKERLERLGYKVTPHTNSIEALEAFQACPEYFDLVITDYTMPRLNGADLAKHMLKARPDLPVIIVTGYSSTINSEMATSIGIRELLMKPTTAQAIGDAVYRTLANEGKV